MTSIYRITGYGETVDFSTLADAQDAARAAYQDETTLTVRGGVRIIDERGEQVGEVIEADVRCECGRIYGEHCEWTGPEADTVTVEVMPEYLRSSHTAAGNRGVYPANGALRLCVEPSCADRLVETEGDWATILSE